ncbi:MAG TPA: Sir2 family NAD-dependent protein deacetylase, partial [Candidatus Polarisedimenticolaceae bacterium]|nr:Sir2 family NAD-dependent protein deacetylase [Candidatus Polarisedimenticolaceae bacterium]
MATFDISARLRSRLRRDRPVVALTGAGISAESGLATFRGPGGLWEGRDPLELATPEAFARDPQTVWRFYGWRRRQALAARPNAAHLALARWRRHAPGFTLITQNVDGLHERAGNHDLIRLHGTLWRLRCVTGDREFDDQRENVGEP